MRNYLGIMMSPPQETSEWAYKNFTARVKAHMVKGPFANLLPERIVPMLLLRREAAYLYDAVKLYARSLREVLEEGGDPLNGTRIIQKLMKRPYFRYTAVRSQSELYSIHH